MENEAKKISSYIRDILSGRPIAEIPRHLILKVHDAFVANRSKFNINVTKYDQIIQEFKNVEKRFRLNGKEKQTTKNIQIRTVQIVDKKEENENTSEVDEIANMVEKLIDGAPFEIIQTESIESIIEYCKQKIDKLVKNSELNKANDHQNLLNEMIQLSYERKYLSSIESKKEGISKKVAFFQQKIDEEKEKMYDINQKIDQETFYLLQLEEEEWAKFQLEFDIETDQGPPPKFSKLSSKLLNLKQVEKFLIKSKRFLEASKIHEISSQLEEKELNIQHEIFINERKNKKKQLSILHQARIQDIQSNAEKKKVAIEKKSQDAINSLNNAIQNILIKEKDINDLINEEKKIQNDEINSSLQSNKVIPKAKVKKKKKVVKRVHFDESIFQ